MLETLLGKLGLSVLTRTAAKALGSIDNDIAKNAAKALDKVEDQIAKGAITIDQIREANRHIEAMSIQDSEILKTINASLQAEAGSNDAYVRRMRPTFGYFMAMTWAAQMFAVAYIMVFETEKADVVINAVESLSSIWAVGLSVLGIYVYKRSSDKRYGLNI
tara:strand:+ start:49 stop:534 length:486 start_codon:yes stop_codon:yes gene_type:complete